MICGFSDAVPHPWSDQSVMFENIKSRNEKRL